MAHKKGVGSSRNGRDSNPKYRGIKKYGGEFVTAGNIIVRHAAPVAPGRNVAWDGSTSIRWSMRSDVRAQEQARYRSVTPRPSGVGEYVAALTAARYMGRNAPHRGGVSFIRNPGSRVCHRQRLRLRVPTREPAARV